MKKNIIKVLFLLPIIAGVMFTSCKDEFTEKDALDAQQSIDLSIMVYDAVSDLGIVGATVTIYNNGEAVTAESNELGFANFSKVRIAEELFFRVQKEGYAKFSSSIYIDIDNFRQGQYSAIVPLYSLTTNTAIVTGKIEIETNMTNENSEFAPEGTKVYAYLDEGGMPVEFMTTVNANGYYELVLPASNTGLDYTLRYETLTLTQTIAKNGNAGDPEFPATLPSIVDISTVYNPTGTALNIPDVRSVYATVNQTTTGDVAIISSVVVNGDGEIDDLIWSDAGSDYTADSVDITVVSLFTGSGAVIRANAYDGASGSVQTNNEKYYNRGSGYPDFLWANRSSASGHSFITSISNLKSGEIRVINGDYGVGTKRDTEIE